MVNHLNLDTIKNAFEHDINKISFGERLRFDQVKWLIEQAEKAKQVERILSCGDFDNKAKLDNINDLFFDE
jgi:hypothetical protein